MTFLCLFARYFSAILFQYFKETDVGKKSFFRIERVCSEATILGKKDSSINKMIYQEQAPRFIERSCEILC